MKGEDNAGLLHGGGGRQGGSADGRCGGSSDVRRRQRNVYCEIPKIRSILSWFNLIMTPYISTGAYFLRFASENEP